MLSENIDKAKKNISSCGGKNVTIVAATKTISPEIISSLPALGITIAGENRVQELLSKYEEVSGITWHFIGRLQRNKVKYIVDKVAMIHSVDSVALADEIDNRCAKIDKVMPVLVELNMGEESKGGVAECDLMPLCEHIASLAHLELKGLMCVMPKGASEQMFAKLKSIFDRLSSKFVGADILSAGMSGDYETAVKYGANMVRLGSCLFGQRVYNN